MNDYKSKVLKSGSKEYARIHYWMRKNYGSPSICESTLCKGSSTVFDWALKRGLHHTKDRAAYLRLCRPCHTQYDWTEAKTKRLFDAGHTKEVSEKRRIGLIGRKHTEAARRLMCKNSGVKRRVMFFKQGSPVYEAPSIAEAAAIIGANPNSVWCVVSGRYPTIKGFRVKYV